MENYTVEQLIELIALKPNVMLPGMFVLNWQLIETTKLPTILLNAKRGWGGKFLYSSGRPGP